MRKAVLALYFVLLVPVAASAQSHADARAAAIVDEMMHAMGGQAAWERARYLRFDWVVERDGKQVAYVRHLWDRWDGRYRVEWKTRDGQELVALFNVNTRSGKVTLNGEPPREEDLQKYLDQAYQRFINDSYWLLMPWKLNDPGVKLEYAGEAEMDGKKHVLIHVSFENVGLTPGDHYWAFINPETLLMERWAYFLESYAKDKGEPALEKATPWEWRDWHDVGGIKLAGEKRMVGQDARIYFPVLRVLPEVDAHVFDSFDATLPDGE